jgi:predicted DNA-binding mobile mystery protein A
VSTKVLKLRQISELIKSGSPLPMEKIGQRLKDIRKTLGMTQKQMARKMGISRQAVTQLEKKMESANLKTLEKYSDIFKCRLLMGIVSTVPLEKIIQSQARKTAERILKRTYATMALEKQAPGDKAYREELEELARELALNPNSSLWEEE